MIVMDILDVLEDLADEHREIVLITLIDQLT